MAEKNETEAKVAVASKGGMLTVIGPEAGRWRGGIHFTRTPKPLEIAKLSAEQIKQIESDPLLKTSRS